MAMKTNWINRAVKLSFFYTIFYAVLAAFFAVIFGIFLATLDDTEPKWKLEESLIGNNPSLTIRPRPLNDIFVYKAGDEAFIKIWKEQLDSFLEPYLRPKNEEKLQVCFMGQQPQPDHVCDFRLLVADFAPCLPEYGYGFDVNNIEQGPCIFLKMNKIFGWVPKPYTSNNAPPQMPQNLIEKMKESEQWNHNEKIWIDCIPGNSTKPEDVGPITYHPYQGFEQQYFPYKNVPGYLSPLVAIHFKRPKRGVLLKIECRAWASNIRQDRRKSQGLIRFGLRIE